MRREPTFDENDWDARDDEPGFRQLGRPKPFARARLAARFVVAAALIAGLTVAAKNKLHPIASQDWTEPTRASAALARAAVAVPQGGPLLTLEASAGEAAARSEPPRWSPATGLREDALSGGGFQAIEAPFLRVSVTETAPATDPAASLFVTLARRAAEVQGLSVIRTGLRGRIETKFGPFETVEATLSGDGTRSCTGFQSLETHNLRIDGWLCGVLGQPPEPRALACTLDRLKLSGPAAPTVETAFQEAETRRLPACGVQTVRSPRADATGSIGARNGSVREAGKAEAKGRARKNEAQMRQNAKAGQ